ncbi:UDP-N-acetylmuramate dehydrogenase [Candidatus Gracilibacteria bacterium]|nr:UDP-N-acetylmuramate dehydrogenase [Candidatus Gracilibacteria bacterium]
MNPLQNFPQLKQSESLAKHTTFRIGGPADYFYELHDLAELPQIIAAANHQQIPYFLFGAGSNILFSDKGFRGLIIKIAAKKITISADHIIAESGALISELISQMLAHDLAGLEPWVGLPGTVGGAVYGNAGCSGLETKDCLISAEIFHPENAKITTETPETLDLHYRHSNLKGTNKIVLSTTFRITTCQDKDAQTAQITALRQDRFQKQPFGVLTTGSFFKNPFPEKPAGILLDQAGLKGFKIGDAQISEKHANFFINKGRATAQDILDLMHHAQKTVHEKFQIDLIPEVQIIPEHPL